MTDSARMEAEELRAALHSALGWWAQYERQEFADKFPPLAKQSGGEGDDYRRCLALLDPVKAEAAIRALVANQAPLDPDARRALHENIWELYG